MLKFAKVIAASGLLSALAAANSYGNGFAESIIDYQPGVNFSTEFGTGLGFTNSAAALGLPSTATPGEFGGPVNPFNPPYLRDQVVSLGEGGSLTVQLSTPVLDSDTNPFGIDFLVFGNSGFIITNGNFSGGGVTDGTLFAANEFDTRISVSPDNQTYYSLNPLFAPIVDSYYPTDGTGNFFHPVDPSLRGADFSGKDLAGIRTLYAGSAGGTGYDLSWAVDGNGLPISLREISYIKVETLSGVSEIDAFVVVPEPAAWTLFLVGACMLGWFLFKKD